MSYYFIISIDFFLSIPLIFKSAEEFNPGSMALTEQVGFIGHETTISIPIAVCKRYAYNGFIWSAPHSGFNWR
jgi:hypothetical protein